MAITLLDMTSSSMDKAIAGAAGTLQVMKPPTGMSFKVTMELDSKIEKEVNKDALVNQQMRDAMQAVYEDLVKRIGDNLKNTDKGAITLRDANDKAKLDKLVEVVNKGIVGARDVAVERAQKEAMKVWDDLAKKRKEYTKYKAKIITKVTLGVAGLAVSIGLIAGGVVSFGASSIPGVVGMVKTVVLIGSQLKSAHEEIEKAQARLDKQFKEMEKKFINAKGELSKRGMAQEVAQTLAAQFLGTTGPFALGANIKEAVGNLDVIKSKFNGITVNAHDAAKNLNAMIDGVEKAKAKFISDIDKKLANASPKAKADRDKIIRKLENQVLAPFEDKVQDALIKVHGLIARQKTAEPRIKVASDRLAKLTALKGAGFAVFENLLVFSDVAISFTDPSQFAELSTTLAGLVPGVASLAADKVTKVVFEGTVLE